MAPELVGTGPLAQLLDLVYAVRPIKMIENVVLFHSTKKIKSKKQKTKRREGQDKMTPKGHNK